MAAPVVVGSSSAFGASGGDVGAVALVFLHVTHDAALLGPMVAQSATQIAATLRAA